MNTLSTTAIFAALLTLSACKVTQPEASETAPVGPSVLTEQDQQAAMSGKVSFKKHVAPVLESRCLPCHNGKTMPNLFSMTSRAAAFQAGALGPRIVPGSKPALFESQRHSQSHPGHAARGQPPDHRGPSDPASLDHAGRRMARGKFRPAQPSGIACPPGGG